MTNEEKEAIEVLKNMDIEISGLSTCKECIFKDDRSCINSNRSGLSNGSN